MDTDELLRLRAKAIIWARRLKFADQAEDIAQECCAQWLAGHHRKATVRQTVIDVIRREYGTKRYSMRLALGNKERLHRRQTGVDDKNAFIRHTRAGSNDVRTSTGRFICLADQIATYPYNEIDARIDIGRLFRFLEPRELYLIWKIYLYGANDVDVATELKVCPSRVSQLKNLAFKKIHNMSLRACRRKRNKDTHG